MGRIAEVLFEALLAGVFGVFLMASLVYMASKLLAPVGRGQGPRKAEPGWDGLVWLDLNRATLCAECDTLYNVEANTCPRCGSGQGFTIGRLLRSVLSERG